ncbi:GldG family protein [Thermodesulfobacteriota bacterium]
MNRFSKFAGIAGIILFLFGIVSLFFAGFAPSLYSLIHMIGGLVLIAVSFAFNFASLRDNIGNRSTRHGANAIVYTVIVLVIVVLVNFIANRHTYRFDLTESKIFSLSDQTVKILEGLEEEVSVIAFSQLLPPKVEDLLKSYAYETEKLTYRVVDPVKNPEVAERHGITMADTILVAGGPKEIKVSEPTEEAITNAIIKVLKADQKTLYFLEGHGEPGLEDQEAEGGYFEVKKAIENENYAVKTILLATLENVPEDCSVLVVADPERMLLDNEVNAINRYLEAGGSALFMVEPRSLTGVESILGKWGIRVGNNIVVDQVIRLFMGPALGTEPIVDSYEAHAITKDFVERTVFPGVRSIGAAKESVDGVTLTELAKTSPGSWAESDLDRLYGKSEAEFGAGDEQGPIPVAAAATGGAEGNAKIVAFGDAEFVNNKYFHYMFNGDLFLNTIGWLAGQEELISIRPRMTRASRVQLTTDQSRSIFYASVLIIPEILLLFGVGVWWWRRR